MTITVFLRKEDIRKDLHNIYAICTNSDIIMRSNNTLEYYKRLYNLKGDLRTSAPEIEFIYDYVQLNISFSDYTTLCYFLETEI